jgi:NAD-dependent dihydropyrimidine dehydrogenase PreA subunit
MAETQRSAASGGAPNVEHGVFIAVEVDESVRRDPALAAKLTEVCPVDIYAVGPGGTLEIVDENLDECVLCRLCIDAAPPGTVKIHKLYSGETLE